MEIPPGQKWECGENTILVLLCYEILSCFVASCGNIKDKQSYAITTVSHVSVNVPCQTLTLMGNLHVHSSSREFFLPIRLEQQCCCFNANMQIVTRWFQCFLLDLVRCCQVSGVNVWLAQLRIRATRFSTQDPAPRSKQINTRSIDTVSRIQHNQRQHHPLTDPRGTCRLNWAHFEHCCKDTPGHCVRSPPDSGWHSECTGFQSGSWYSVNAALNSTM